MVTLLHTSPVHIATFDHLAENYPGITIRHIVDEQLLNDARLYGLTPNIQQRVDAILSAAAQTGVEVILCTCSTIGGLAEASNLPQPVLRVDRPMMERAIELGQQIRIAATVSSTLAPTRALLEDTASRANCEVVISELLCDQAWAFFEAGDIAGYHRYIAEALRADLQRHPADVVVLAQASMAGAVQLCADIGVPILSSPALGFAAAVRAATKPQNH